MHPGMPMLISLNVPSCGVALVETTEKQLNTISQWRSASQTGLDFVYGTLIKLLNQIKGGTSHT